MLDALRQVANLTSETNSYLGDGPANRARRDLDALSSSAHARERWRLTMQLAGEELRLGHERDAIRLFSQALDLVPRTTSTAHSLNYTFYQLGVAYMRAGETQNCAQHPNPESCILPLRGDGIHDDQTPSREAIAAFSRVLEKTPHPNAQSFDLDEDASRLHLAARWLLNIAYMTVGGYPQDVPPSYLIPVETFRPVGRIPRFKNIAPYLGLDVFDLSGGAVADDFDGDGYLDIVVSTWDTEGQIRFFRNRQDGTFADQTGQAGLSGLFGGLNLLHRQTTTTMGTWTSSSCAGRGFASMAVTRTRCCAITGTARSRTSPSRRVLVRCTTQRRRRPGVTTTMTAI